MNNISKSLSTLPRVRSYHKLTTLQYFKATRNENDSLLPSIRSRRVSTVFLSDSKKKSEHLNFSRCHGSGLKYLNACRTISNFYHGSEYGSFKTENEITDEMTTKILRKYEMSVTMKEDFDNKNLNPVISFESNILPSNFPLEDRRAQAKFHHNTDLSMLFGVFDGHGGHQCSHAVSTRLFLYVALALLPHDQLESTLRDLEEGKPWPALLEWYQHSRGPSGTSLQSHQVARLRRFMEKRLNKEIVIENVEDALHHCCVELDNDILNDAEHQTEYKTKKHANPDLAAIDCAMSGCVACIAHFAGDIMSVANIGDCHAVLGSRDSVTPGRWIATPLSHKHNSMNQEEKTRILSEHPENERDSVIRNDRLLGSLAPFRAFGNARFKWPAELINEVSMLSLDSNSDIGVGGDYRIPDQTNWILPNYRTPPYLTSKPDIIQHELQPNDAFVVLATDGLWDMMRKRDIVQIIGEFIDRQENRYDAEKQSEFFTESCDVMDSDTALFGMEDTNAATHIIRHSIGQTFDGASRRQVRAMLNLSKEESRSYRDDITVTVIKLNPLVL